MSEILEKADPEQLREVYKEEMIRRFNIEIDNFLGIESKAEDKDKRDTFPPPNLGAPLHGGANRRNRVLSSERQNFDLDKQSHALMIKIYQEARIDDINERAQYLAEKKVKELLAEEREKLKEEMYRKAKTDLELKGKLVEIRTLAELNNDYDVLRSKDKLSNEEREVLVSMISLVEVLMKDASIFREMIRELLDIKIERYSVEEVSTVLEGMKLHKYTNKIYPAQIGDNIGDDRKRRINNIVKEILNDRNIEIRKRKSTSGKIRNRTNYLVFPHEVEALIYMRETYREYSKPNKEVEA